MKNKKQLFTTFPVTSHTDFIQQGGTFVVIKGQKEDGAHYIKTAVEKGARTIVLQEGTELSQELQQLITDCAVSVNYVPDTRKALAYLSAQAAGFPAQQLKIFAVSGTKGKTTTTWMLAHLLKALGKKVACITTAQIFLDTGINELADYDCDGGLTTPQPDYLHQFLKLCVQKGVEYVVLEVAVQAHTFSRLEGIVFEGIIFTNIDQEHSELYPTIEHYFQEKQMVFEHAIFGAPFVINSDDVYGQRLLQAHPQAKSFSIKHTADFKGTLKENTLYGQKALIEYENKQLTFFYRNFPGNYNLSNMTAAVGLLIEHGFAMDKLNQKEIAIAALPGRFEIYPMPNGSLVCIDYAHTGGSFESVLSAVRPWTDHLIVVFGAGGGKDSLKRPLMGDVASQIADSVIITDDNPRFESPVTIAHQVLSGVKPECLYKVSIEHDREKAIKAAYAHSRSKSIIMLLGKGPDTVQIIQDHRHYFSEKEVLKSLVVS